HVIPFFREYTKNAFMRGTYIINNPFRFYLEKYFAYSVAKKIGVKIPRTVLLPVREYPPGVTESDLGNLDFPLNWGNIHLQVGGFPAVLKPSEGGGWKDVFVVNSREELMEAYEKTGSQVMLLQEYIDYEHYVRALVFGKKYVLPIKYNPAHKMDSSQQAYIVDHQHLTPELGKIIVEQSIQLCRVLDYDMNSVEFAIKDGVPYAIDFCNQVPDMRTQIMPRIYYNWGVEALARVAVEYALNPPLISAWPSLEPFIYDEMIRRFEAKV
ncbi:MAG: RimK family alpha-L-glutamate ligase, partial [Vulcanimicrobiota bacterium]